MTRKIKILQEKISVSIVFILGTVKYLDFSVRSSVTIRKCLQKEIILPTNRVIYLEYCSVTALQFQGQ